MSCLELIGGCCYVVVMEIALVASWGCCCMLWLYTYYDYTHMILLYGCLMLAYIYLLLEVVGRYSSLYDDRDMWYLLLCMDACWCASFFSHGCRYVKGGMIVGDGMDFCVWFPSMTKGEIVGIMVCMDPTSWCCHWFRWQLAHVGIDVNTCRLANVWMPSL